MMDRFLEFPLCRKKDREKKKRRVGVRELSCFVLFFHYCLIACLSVSAKVLFCFCLTCKYQFSLSTIIFVRTSFLSFFKA